MVLRMFESLTASCGIACSIGPGHDEVRAERRAQPRRRQPERRRAPCRRRHRRRRGRCARPGRCPGAIDRSMFCAWARRRASGEALIRSALSPRGRGLGRGGGGVARRGRRFDRAPAAGQCRRAHRASVQAPLPAALSPAVPPPQRGEGLIWRPHASSPSPAMIAIGAPTFTPSVPSGTRILAILPSSTASNSIVALSVSISARMSPDFTSSPSLTSHLASVPSSIVGESAGILSSIGMRACPGKARAAQSQCGGRGQVCAESPVARACA